MKRAATILLILFVFVGLTNAQSISLSATGGLTLVQGPDALTKDISEGGAGFSSAPHFGLKGRFKLPVIPLAITGQVLYTKFTGEGNATITGGTTASVETESSLLLMGVGAEYKIVPGPISPYAAIDLFYANSGKFKYKATALGSTNEITVDGENRTGIGFGAGLQIGILPMIDIDVSAKYNINNLIGKEDGEETFSTINLSASLSFGF